MPDKSGMEWYFSESDLVDYYTLQCNGLYISSVYTIKRALNYFLLETKGKITKEILVNLCSKFWNESNYSMSHKRKIHIYITNFIKHLVITRDDPTLSSVLYYFRMPKCRREIKLMTARIIISNDITRLVNSINNAHTLSAYQKLRHVTFVLFMAYTGQRPMTAERITVGQIRHSLSQDMPVLTVSAKQDKNRMEHYVPLHPILIPYLTKLIDGKKDDERVFTLNGLCQWLKDHPQSMENTDGQIRAMDLRKYFEQMSDQIGYTDAYKNFLMSHGCSSIGWTSYKQFLPKEVYKHYIEKWGDVVIFQTP